QFLGGCGDRAGRHVFQAGNHANDDVNLVLHHQLAGLVYGALGAGFVVFDLVDDFTATCAACSVDVVDCQLEAVQLGFAKNGFQPSQGGHEPDVDGVRGA